MCKKKNLVLFFEVHCFLKKKIIINKLITFIYLYIYFKSTITFYLLVYSIIFILWFYNLKKNHFVAARVRIETSTIDSNACYATSDLAFNSCCAWKQLCSSCVSSLHNKIYTHDSSFSFPFSPKGCSIWILFIIY